MKIGALVPARGGSKRIPGKNIRMLGGKPLLCWTLDALLEADVFDRVTVSTESPELADIVNGRYPRGAVDILERPAELASDKASLESVHLHYLECNSDIDMSGVFMPTYPFRDVDKLCYIDRHLRSRYVWKVASLSEERFCTGDFFYPVEGGVKRIFDQRFLFCQRYNSCYWYHSTALMTKGPASTFFDPGERTLTVNLSPREDIDIDNEYDWNFAENIAEGKHLRYRRLVETAFGQWTIVAPEGVDPAALVAFVGEKKFEELSRPLVVLENNHHNYARMLHLDGPSMRPYYISLPALRYINSLTKDGGGFSQSFPTEFQVCRFYRILRTPPWNQQDPEYGYPDVPFTRQTWSDNNGLRWGTGYDDPDVAEFNSPAFSPVRILPSILPSDRVVQYDELMKQPWFVSPYFFE